MLAPTPPNDNTGRSTVFWLIQLRIAMLELGCSLELRPKYASLAPDAFAMATLVADVTRIEALR